jgi:chemotaxis protein MotB
VVSKKRRQESHEDHPDETWLIPYSDLLTLLLALFIVLYSVSSLNVSKLQELQEAFSIAFNSGFGLLSKSSVVDNGNMAEDAKQRIHSKSQEELKQEEQQSLEKLKRQLDQYIRQNGLSSQLETQLNQSQLMITIRDNALFASGSADIKPESRKLAVAIGQMLQNYKDYEVIVSGHTDNQPINTPEFASNWELSSKRAINFMKILLQNKAFDPRRFSAIGYGEYRPVDSNDTEAGRARNRRVEVSILRKYTDPSANPADTELSVIADGGQAPASPKP